MRGFLRALLFLFLTIVATAGLALSACGGFFAMSSRPDRNVALIAVFLGVVLVVAAVLAIRLLLKSSDESDP